MVCLCVCAGSKDIRRADRKCGFWGISTNARLRTSTSTRSRWGTRAEDYYSFSLQLLFIRTNNFEAKHLGENQTETDPEYIFAIMNHPPSTTTTISIAKHAPTFSPHSTRTRTPKLISIGLNERGVLGSTLH